MEHKIIIIITEMTDTNSRMCLADFHADFHADFVEEKIVCLEKNSLNRKKLKSCVFVPLLSTLKCIYPKAEIEFERKYSKNKLNKIYIHIHKQ